MLRPYDRRERRKEKQDCMLESVRPFTAARTRRLSLRTACILLDHVRLTVSQKVVARSERFLNYRKSVVSMRLTVTLGNAQRLADRPHVRNSSLMVSCWKRVIHKVGECCAFKLVVRSTNPTLIVVHSQLLSLGLSVGAGTRTTIKRFWIPQSPFRGDCVGILKESLSLSNSNSQRLWEGESKREVLCILSRLIHRNVLYRLS